MILFLLDQLVQLSSSLNYIQQLLPPPTIGGISLLAPKLTSSLIYIQWQPILPPQLTLRGITLLAPKPKLHSSLIYIQRPPMLRKMGPKINLVRLPSPHQAGGFLAENRAKYVHHYHLELQANPQKI